MGRTDGSGDLHERPGRQVDLKVSEKVSLESIHKPLHLADVDSVVGAVLAVNAAPQLPGVLRVHRVHDVQRGLRGHGPGQLQVPDIAAGVAAGPQGNQPVQSGGAQDQRAKVTVEGTLEPGLDQSREGVGAAAAEQREADKVGGQRLQVLAVSVHARQPAAPRRLQSVCPERCFGMDLKSSPLESLSCCREAVLTSSFTSNTTASAYF